MSKRLVSRDVEGLPVHRAFEACRPDRIRELSGQGADVDATYPDGDTLLHKLPERFQRWPEELMLETAKTLIECGASLEAVDSQGRPPLARLQEAKAELLREDPRERNGEWRMAMDDLLTIYEGQPLPRRGM